MRHLSRISLSCLSLLILMYGLGAQTTPWREARPDFRWAFPRDHWAHPGYRTEWWYFTGHLQTGDTRVPEVAYQFTFFRNGAVPETLDLESEWNSGQFIMGHAALSLPAEDRHLFSEILYRESPLLGGFGAYPDPRIAWSLGPAGTRETWLLEWNGQGFDFAMRDSRQGLGFQLRTRTARGPVLQGPGGLSRKSPDGSQASLYYSLTRLETEGEVRLGEQTWSVSGLSWMDKEFGSSMLSDDQPGWDWFGLQLEDGRDLMVYRLRDRSGNTSYANATLVGKDQSVRYLGDCWQLTEEAWWKSTRTGSRYPVRWRLNIPEAGLDFEIAAAFPEQENHSLILEGLDYWEGSVRLTSRSGVMLGRGFGELTGYGPGSRPPI